MRDWGLLDREFTPEITSGSRVCLDRGSLTVERIVLSALESRLLRSVSSLDELLEPSLWAAGGPGKEAKGGRRHCY